MKFSCGHFSRIFPSFVLCAIACAPAQAQIQPAEDQTQAPQAAPGSSSPAPPAVRRGLPILRDADERAWVVDVEYFAPQPGFDRLNRDIDVSDIRLARAWHFSSGWECELDAMALRASGTRTTGASPAAIERSDTPIGVGFGPAVRWNFLQLDRVRLFGNLAPNVIFTENNFPAGGTKYNFLLRAGAGAAFRIADAYWLEAGFFWAHISNDTGLVPGNPAWQGRGVTLSMRHAEKNTSLDEPKGRGVPILRDADENAWVTSAEYFAPLTFNNRLDPGLNIRDYRVARVWHFSNGLELQLGGLVLPSPMSSGAGPMLRWNFLQAGRWRVFADGEADVIKGGFFFIPQNDPYNLFVRGGAGASYRIHDTYWLEVAYRWGRTLGGLNGMNQYSSWTGAGPSLALRHTFGNPFARKRA
jgi:hypothetical protein